MFREFTWKRRASITAAWAIIVVINIAQNAELAFGQPQPSTQHWKLVTKVDRLDPTKKQIFAYVAARSPIVQFGHQVSTSLIVYCVDNTPLAELNFSEPVAIGKKYLRWRVDDLPVNRDFSPDGWEGKELNLLFDLGTRIDTIAELERGKVLRAELQTSWAGNVLLEFDIVGLEAVIKKITMQVTGPY